MKSNILFLILMIYTSFSNAQNTLTATYTSGDIATSYASYDNSCNGSCTALSFVLPAGESYTVTDVQVSYSMTATGLGYMSDQRSRLYFRNKEVAENTISGLGGVGTYIYNRNTSIANGTFAGGTALIFELQAYRTFGAPGECNTTFNKVDNNSWTITLTYSNEVIASKVGINNSNPESVLDIKGRLKVGDDYTTPKAGMVRWNEQTQDFEGFNGDLWVSFTKRKEVSSWGNAYVSESESFVADGSNSYDNFGYAVDIEGNYAVASAYTKDIGSNIGQGQVNVFTKINGRWILDGVLNPSDGGEGDLFGHSVAIDNNTIVVGAKNKDFPTTNNAGKVYVFEKILGTWTEVTSFFNIVPDVSAQFGWAVDIKGDYFAVSSPTHDALYPDQGKVYLYKKSFGTWNYYAVLESPIPEANDWFGMSLSMSNEFLVVGCPYCNNDTIAADVGKAFVFKRMGHEWIFTPEILVPPYQVADGLFGFDVDVLENTIAVGAPSNFYDPNATDGSVFLFNKSVNSWNISDYVSPTNGELAQAFGVSIKLNDEKTLVVGAHLKKVKNISPAGQAYLYEKSATNWHHTASFASSNTVRWEKFGYSVASFENTILIGAYDKIVNGNNGAGEIYFFNKN